MGSSAETVESAGENPFGRLGASTDGLEKQDVRNGPQHGARDRVRLSLFINILILKSVFRDHNRETTMSLEVESIDVVRCVPHTNPVCTGEPHSLSLGYTPGGQGMQR